MRPGEIKRSRRESCNKGNGKKVNGGLSAVKNSEA
jgi:hypothetical protein